MSQLDHESFLNIPVTRHSTQRDSENKGKRHGVEFQYNQGEVKSEPQVQSLVGISAHLNSQAELEFKNAQLLLAADEAELGRILLQSVLAKKPKHQPALLALAESLEKEGHLEEAIPYYSEGLKLKESGSAHLSLAKIYEKLGQYDEASNHFILGLEYPDLIKSELFEIYKSLGSISLRQQDYDAAEEYYNRAFTIKPHSDVLLVNYGTLEIQRASWNAAAYRFRSAVSINSENDK
ncbi:MAG: tetratricopeptide repeat protein, partial [Bdellovibrionales bacterium]|nr:tetratricopeptide repeat protein [Bdellovibrionales bacterium]